MAVDIDGLTRLFHTKNPPAFGRSSLRPEVVALDAVSLQVDQGEIHGLLGPNGAGKTTLVKILATILLPTSGTARVMGHDVVSDTAAVRPLIGIVLGGERGLYNRLTARQNLRYWAALYKLEPKAGWARVDELLRRVGLEGRADERVQSYSRGMRQRLHLARGLVNDPPVLFLDEPSTGMDPVAARELRVIVTELAAEGRTVFLTTHDMAEAEALCNRVTLIDHGRLLATETPRQLSTMLSRFERIECEGAADGVIKAVGALRGVSTVTSKGVSTRIEVDTEGVVAEVMRHLVSSGVTSVRVTRPSLEEVYLSLIGERGMDV
ncbi:MAG TPA: ABC transporter ATP-binding protein [Acidimicrobiales bacterium]|nr:ABC transporter ATP-binding protein [Acidimicrobiales bacterium]